MRGRRFAIPVGLVIFIVGCIWFLQGIGVLPGSFMTGSQFWAVAGGFAAIVGLAIVALGASGKK